METASPTLTALTRDGMTALALTACATLALSTGLRASDPRFTSALDAAAIRQDTLTSASENNLLIGNGDVNALLYSGSSGLKLRLTKNDVWDARLDTSSDPALPVIDIATHSWTGTAGDPPSWSKSYPCPLTCAVLDLTSTVGNQVWQNIRAEGATNTWTYATGLATMAVQGSAGSSCGWKIPITTVRSYTSVRVRLSGTTNVQYFIEVLKNGGGSDGSLWQITPTTDQDYVFTLPVATDVVGLILYARTTDGALAQNHYSTIELRGDDGNDLLDLSQVNPASALNELDLRRAVATVPGNTSTVAVRALADRNVFLIEGDTTVTLNPTSASFVPATTRGTLNGVEYFVQTLPADPGYPTTGDWPGMSFAVAKAVQGQRTAVAIVTSMESPTPQAAAIALANEAIAADAATLRQVHETLWDLFWSASRVDLGDAYLRDVWYRNLYFMRCVSKAGVKPTALFAGLLNDSPDWHGDYHLNYNMQQTFWGWYGCNHAELSEPYEAFINGLIPRAKWLANKTYGCDGAFFPHSTFLYEPTDPATCKSNNGRQMVFIPYTYTIGNSGWAVHNHWLHYKHHPDQALLQNQVYPPIKQVALFYADFAEKCATNPTTGKAILGPTYSPEHWTLGKDDGTADIAFARMTLKAAIEGATKLGVDATLITRWQQTLTKIPDYPRTTGVSPVIVDVAGVPPTTYNVPVPALPVYPAGEIHWFSSAEDRQIFANTISGMSCSGFNEMIILAGARARLSMADAYSWTRAQLQARQRSNGQLRFGSGYEASAPFTENFAATGAINELLLQSVNDILRIFPAWPADRDAAFENLRAQGGFLVSSGFKNGVTTACTIRSTVGGRLRFLNPWPATPVAHINNATIALTDEGGGIFGLDTETNDQIILAPASLPNLLTNGSFENDVVGTFGATDSELSGTANYAGVEWGEFTATGWSKSARVWFTAEGTESFPDGNNAYILDGGDYADGKSVLAQGGLPLVAGKTYQLTFALWGQGSALTENLDVRLTHGYSSLTDLTSGTGILILDHKATSGNDGGFEKVTVEFTPTVSTNYALQFIADTDVGEEDADHIWIDDVVLTENVALIGYATWASSNGVVGNPDVDSDNDGVENGVEYFMGITSSDPVLTVNPALNPTNRISWPMSATFSGTYEVEISTNLSNWTPVNPKPAVVGGYLTYTLASGAEGGKNFVRLAVTPD